MKKILYASQKMHVPMSEGGGEVIAFDLLSEVQKTGLGQVSTLGSFKYIEVHKLNQHLIEANSNLILNQQGTQLKTYKNEELVIPGLTHLEYVMPNSYRTTLARDDHYSISFDEFIRQFNPDACLLQAEGALEAWSKLSLRNNCKTMLYVQNGLEPNQFKQYNISPPTCLANSKFIQSMIKSKFNLESHLLYPAINIERYFTDHLQKDENEKFTVLYINPNQVKGLNVFLHVAKALPNINFKVLEGWAPISPNLKHHLTQFPNVECLDRTWDIVNIYNSVDMLMVPSQWEEAFGRVVVEAHAAGLPTIASQVGGLPEASGEAGLLVPDFKNAETWAKTIQHVEANRSMIEERKPLLKQNAERFTPDKAAKTFMEIINT